MNVDCADEIISDISNGSPLRLEMELFRYMRNNFIGYIILSGFENSNIFGNRQMENALKDFLIHARDSFPGIQIGLGASDAGPFQSSAPVMVSLPSTNGCFPQGNISGLNAFNQALNNTGPNAVDLRRSEICKFFLKAASFVYNFGKYNPSKFNKYVFDSFYLEYRYWTYTASLSTMQNEFTNFKTILSLMRTLKCAYNSCRFVEAEFLPSEIYNLQGWTAIDQITEADPLMDRMMLPSFTSNADFVFDQVCKTMHFLSDRFSKPKTIFFIGMSAEDNSFSYCNSTLTPHNYLGDYLNGTVIPNGNLYSVEKQFLIKFNNSNYMCQSCSCFPYTDNHYTSTNIYGNALAGSMWTPYSMLKTHNLFRQGKISLKNESDNEIISIHLINTDGKFIKSYHSKNDFKGDKSNPQGIYFLKTQFKDGRVETEKVVSVQEQ